MSISTCPAARTAGCARPTRPSRTAAAATRGCHPPNNHPAGRDASPHNTPRKKEFTIRAGLAAVAQFEDQHGAFTPDELAEADQWATQAAERASHTGTSQRRST